MPGSRYYTYLMTNDRHTVIYTGMTNNLRERVKDHIDGKSKFTAKYNVYNLVYFEEYGSPGEAIKREKQIKAGSRAKKEALINEFNPSWRDFGLELLSR